MTTSVVLRLFFHGLIAFVPDKPAMQNPETMTAYVIDHNHHLPTLLFELNGSNRSACPKDKSIIHTSCEEGSAKDGSHWCVCNIAKPVDITIGEQDPNRLKQKIDKPQKANPATKEEAESTSWLVQVASVDKKAAKIKNWDEISNIVRARISFGLYDDGKREREIKACHLDQWTTDDCERHPSDNCEYKIYPIGFAEEANDNPVHSQALAEYALFEQRLSSTTAKININERIRSKDSKDVTIELDCKSGKCPDVLLSNATAQECEGTACDTGHHFKAYYHLSESKPTKNYIPFRQRQEVPLVFKKERLHTCYNDPVRRREIEVLPSVRPNRKSRSAVDTRIICPMAIFDP